MKKKLIGFCILGLIVCISMNVFLGCGKSKNESSEGEYSGNILTIGSTALQPLVEKSAVAFNTMYPDVTINVQGGGSGVGINQVSAESAQIGNSDIPASSKIKDENALKELVETKVCALGFAIVTSKDIGIDNLTTNQIQDIFEGKINNWSEVGGKNIPITVVNRTKSSGTRATFKNTILKDKNEKEGLGITQDSTLSALKVVRESEGAISYVALANLINDRDKEGITKLKIDNIEATTENIVDNKYHFWSYEYMITKGEPKNEVKIFIDFIKSDKNKTVVEKLGYIPIGRFNK